VRQKGFTVIEMLIVVAIVVTVATIAFGMSPGARPMAMRSAVTQFDAALAYAKAIAATSGNGATLLIVPSGPAGFTMSLLSGRPTAPQALQPAGIAPFTSDASISEATLGSPPFALYVNGAGRVSMAHAAVASTPAPAAAEPACPASGEWVLAFTDGRGTDTRRLACGKALP
jgi:prepilin-type N-terminal cleavage/methylation domain-containing protein